jgi:hypothetical protein
VAICRPRQFNPIWLDGFTNFLSRSKYTGSIKPNHLFTTAGNYISIKQSLQFDKDSMDMLF